jgi:hypothetical protein
VLRKFRKSGNRVSDDNHALRTSKKFASEKDRSIVPDKVREAQNLRFIRPSRTNDQIPRRIPHKARKRKIKNLGLLDRKAGSVDREIERYV